jgi:hypothetical protein
VTELGYFGDTPVILNVQGPGVSFDIGNAICKPNTCLALTVWAGNLPWTIGQHRDSWIKLYSLASTGC